MFAILFGFPAIWILAAVAIYFRHPLGGFMAWFMFVGMIFGEPTHLLVFPIRAAGAYDYFPGMWTALFPLVTGIWGIEATEVAGGFSMIKKTLGSAACAVLLAPDHLFAHAGHVHLSSLADPVGAGWRAVVGLFVGGLLVHRGSGLSAAVWGAIYGEFSSA